MDLTRLFAPERRRGGFEHLVQLLSRLLERDLVELVSRRRGEADRVAVLERLRFLSQWD